MIWIPVAFLLGAALGGAAVYGVLRPMLRDLQRDLRVSHDRLYAAWKDDYKIPTTEMVVPPEVKTVHELPDRLRAYIENFESVETRLELRAEANRMIEMGYDEDKIADKWNARLEPQSGPA